jgi:ElaB/YqjD/DUF883 family membrane-anchored ribosome-binding protein
MYTATKEDTVTNLKNTGRDLDLNKVANQAGRKVRSLYNTASEEITHATDTVTSEIRNNPIRSSAIALGAGILIGMLIRR